MEKSKRKTVLIVIGVLLLITISMGISYAFFRGIIGPGAKSNIGTLSKTTDSLNFETGGNLSIIATQQNFTPTGASLNATTTATAKLVPNNNTNSASYTYNVGIYITSNSYIYTTGATATPELILTVLDPTGAAVTSIPGLTYISASGVNGFDVTTKDGLIKITENYPISANTTSTTQNWTFKLTFINLITNQIENAGKSFNSVLKIQSEALPLTIASLCTGKNMASCIKDNYFVEGLDNHTVALENGANDNSFRYSGANPNNYVCFGPGSTAAGTVCPEENQYRIIGIFGNQVKLIKKTSLGNKVWNTNNVNTWAGSTMDMYLNGEYLNNLTLAWSNKIATNEWQVGGMSWGNGGGAIPATAYNCEAGANKANVTSNSKIGLMYVSDYGFAASPSYWSSQLDKYHNLTKNNWLYVGSIHSHEWTMSRLSGSFAKSFFVVLSGYVDVKLVPEEASARPVFYLESSVILNGGNGTAINPYRIN